MSVLAFRVIHEDVGMTLKTSIYLDDYLIVEFMPGTRHTDTADEVAKTVLGIALQPLVEAAAGEQGCRLSQDYRE
jgi:hypothetical protein